MAHDFTILVKCATLHQVHFENVVSNESQNIDLDTFAVILLHRHIK
jgi:hypothetical protein